MFDAVEKLIRSRGWVGKALELAVDCFSFFFKFILAQTSKQFEIVPARGWALAIFGPVEVTELPLELVALALFFSKCSQLRLCHVREAPDAGLRMTSSDDAVDIHGFSRASSVA